jgi:acetyl esterase/lipase
MGKQNINHRGIVRLPLEQERSSPAKRERGRIACIQLIFLCCVAIIVKGCAATGPPRAVSNPPGVEIRRDITFATVEGRDLKLDLYVLEGTQERLPVVLWLHGGGWFTGSRSPCPIAPLALRGYVVAAIEYRRSGVAPFPAQIDDVRAALRWIQENPELCNADPDRIGVFGASAGGTLACLMGLSAGEPADSPGVNGVKCVVALFPPTDLERHFSDESAASWQMRFAVRRLLGGAEPRENPELAKQASPIQWVRPGVAPHLLIHGSEDRLIPAEHSVDFVEQLLDSRVDAQVLIVGGFAHGSAVLANGLVRHQIENFLDHYLQPARAFAAR